MSKKSCIKICERCGKEFEAESGYVHYCNDCVKLQNEDSIRRRREKKFKENQEKLLEGIEGVDYIIDRWNGLATKSISFTWMNKHHAGKTVDDYKKEFPDAPIVCKKTSEKISNNTKVFMNTPEMKKYYSDRIKGDKNPNAKCNTTEEQRKSISPFSKSFKGYDGMSNEDKESMIHSYLQSDREDRTTSQIGYWTKRGYSEEEAKEIVSERQRTFSLEKCIEKYGEEAGKEVWKERQLKWQNSYIHLNYSKISQELFWNLYLRINDVCFFAQNDNGIMDTSGKNHEKRVKTSSSSVSLDFFYPKTNSIIEFDGDYWHSETREYVNKHRDIERDNSLKEVGYNRILHIKESEYNKNKEETIQKCIDFLTRE